MQTLILMHGALGAHTDLEPLSAALQARGISTRSFSFSGHGPQPMHQQFGIGQFTQELHAFISNRQLGKPWLFGYSMGGYVALNYALTKGDAISGVITLGTKFNWSAEAVEKETKLLNPDKMLEKIPAFAAALEKKHGAKWKELMQRTAAMMVEIGQTDFLSEKNLNSLQNKVLLGLGDSDQMVSLEETLATRKAIKGCQLYMLPGTKHPVESANLPVLSALINQQLQG